MLRRKRRYSSGETGLKSNLLRLRVRRRVSTRSTIRPEPIDPPPPDELVGGGAVRVVTWTGFDAADTLPAASLAATV